MTDRLVLLDPRDPMVRLDFLETRDLVASRVHKALMDFLEPRAIPVLLVRLDQLEQSLT